MSWIADYGLIKVANLHIDVAFSICDRSEVTYVAIATDPYRGSLRQILTCRSFEPFVKLARLATIVRVG